MESDLPPSKHDEGASSNLAGSLEKKLSIPQLKQPVRLPEVQGTVNWSLVLFGKLFSSNFMQLSKIEEHLNNQWKLESPIKLKSVHRGVFQWEVKNQVDKEFLLNKGPWLVGGHVFSVKKWEKGTPVEKMDFWHVDFWVQIYQLPPERLDKLYASVLGSNIGTVVEADQGYYVGEFGPYVRARVTLNTKYPLPDSVDFVDEFGDTKSLKIRIERLNIFCFHCGRLGHEKKNCGNRNFITNTVIMQGRKLNGSLRGKTPERDSWVQLLEEDVHASEDLSFQTGALNKDSELAYQGNSNERTNEPCAAEPAVPSTSHVAGQANEVPCSSQDSPDSVVFAKTHDSTEGNKSDCLEHPLPNEASTNNLPSSSLKKSEMISRQIETKQFGQQQLAQTMGECRKRHRKSEAVIQVPFSYAGIGNVKPRLESFVSASVVEKDGANPWKKCNLDDHSMGVGDSSSLRSPTKNLETKSSDFPSSSQVVSTVRQHVWLGGRSDGSMLDTKETPGVTPSQQRCPKH